MAAAGPMSINQSLGIDKLYVALFHEQSVGVIELDPSSPYHHTLVAEVQKHFIITCAERPRPRPLDARMTQASSSSFGSPIDFTYACGGDEATFRPQGVEDADSATLCDPEGDTFAHPMASS